MNLKESIELIQTTGAKVLEARELCRNGITRTYLIPKRTDGGGVEFDRFEVRDVALPWRILAESIEGVVNAVNAHKGGRSIGYVNETMVRIYLDRDDGHEMISHELESTSAWGIVSALEDKWWTQQGLVDALRIEFAGSVRPGEFIGQLAQLKIDSSQETSATLAPGKQAISSSILRQAKLGGVDVPESVTLEGHVFEGMVHAADNVNQVRFAVECALQLDLVKGLFRLVPKAGEIEHARRSAIVAVAQLIGKQTGIEMVCGAMG